MPCMCALHIANSPDPAGRLFNTLFGNQGQQQQAPSSEASHHGSSEGSVRRAQAGTEQQHSAGLGPSSQGRDGNTLQQQRQSHEQAGQETLQIQDEDSGDGNWSLKHQQGMPL